MHPIINTWIIFWHFEEIIKPLRVFQASLGMKEFNHLQYFYTENSYISYLSSAERYPGNTSQGKKKPFHSTAKLGKSKERKTSLSYSCTIRNSSCLVQQTGPSCFNVPQTTALDVCFPGIKEFSGALKPSNLSITTITFCSFTWAVKTAAKQWPWYIGSYSLRHYEWESFCGLDQPSIQRRLIPFRNYLCSRAVLLQDGQNDNFFKAHLIIVQGGRAIFRKTRECPAGSTQLIFHLQASNCQVTEYCPSKLTTKTGSY